MTLLLLREPLNHLDYQLGLTTTVPHLAATAARVAPTFWAREEPLAANTRTHEAALAVLYWTGVTTLVVPQSRGLPQKEGSTGRLSRSRDTRYGTRGPGSRADRNAKTSRHGLLAGDDGASHRRRPSS